MNFHFDKVKWNEIKDLIPNAGWNGVFCDNDTDTKATMFYKRMRVIVTVLMLP